MPTRQTVKAYSVPPATHRHAVQFYEQDSSLIEALGTHIGEALALGDTALVVATKVHRDGLMAELQIRGIDVATPSREGRFIELDASETLAKFMVRGEPNKRKFEKVVGALVKQLEAGLKASRRLVLFGEMVAILWMEGKRNAALRLEELWNGLAQRHSFDLLCAYPISSFDRLEHRHLFFSICGEHTHINPAESYPARHSEMQRRRSVVKLQQQSQALRNEIRIGQERLQMLQKATKSGTWEFDVVTDTFSFSSTAAKLLGLEFSCRLELGRFVNLMYYSGDRDNVLAHLQEGQRHRKNFSVEFRVRRGRETCIITMQGKTFYNNGTPIMLGVLSDVTPSTQNTVVASNPNRFTGKSKQIAS